MKLKGEDIKRLIPQRYPMMMIDEFEQTEPPSSSESLSGASCSTKLSVRSDNLFLLPCGELSESGLIEHMAQSVSALAGWTALQRDASHPPVGMIAEVKHFTCHRRPCSGDHIQTIMRMGFSFGPMTLAQGVSKTDDGIVSEVEMKIFIR